MSLSASRASASSGVSAVRPAEQVGREGDEPGLGQPVAHALEERGEAPPGVEHEHARPLARVGHGHVAGAGGARRHGRRRYPVAVGGPTGGRPGAVGGAAPVPVRSDVVAIGDRDDACLLCAAERITPWYHEDDVCWIAECEICATPMVVWRWHGIEPSPDDLGTTC